MRTAEHLAFAFGLLCLASGVRAAYLLWHDRTSQFDDPWPTWPLGDGSWQDFVRAFPTFAVGTFLSLAFAWPLVALEAGHGRGAAVDVLTLLTATTFLLTMGLTALVMARGRPAGLVPPHLRDRDDDRAAATVGARMSRGDRDG
jgi:hypothetical protein